MLLRGLCVYVAASAVRTGSDLLAGAEEIGYVRRQGEYVNLAVPDRAAAETLVDKAKRDIPGRSPQSLRNADIIAVLGSSLPQRARDALATMVRWKVLKVGGKPWDPAWNATTSNDEILGPSEDTTIMVEPTLLMVPRLPGEEGTLRPGDPTAATPRLAPVDPSRGAAAAAWSSFRRHPLVQSYLETAETESPAQKHANDLLASAGKNLPTFPTSGWEVYDVYYAPPLGSNMKGVPCLDSSDGCFCGWACPISMPLCNYRCHPEGNTPIPTPMQMPPPDDFSQLYAMIYSAITGSKLKLDEMHAAVEAAMLENVNAPPGEGKSESVMDVITKILSDKLLADGETAAAAQMTEWRAAQKLLEPPSATPPSSTPAGLVQSGVNSTPASLVQSGAIDPTKPWQVLSGVDFPTAMLGAEPGPYLVPEMLTAFLASSSADEASMETVATNVLTQDEDLAGNFLVHYKRMLKDINRLGTVSEMASENTAEGAKQEAMSIRSEDHGLMLQSERDLSTLMTGVAEDLMLQKDHAQMKQTQLYNRVRNTVVSNADKEKQAVDGIKSYASEQSGLVAATEKHLAKYQLDVNGLMDTVRAEIASINVLPLTQEQMGKDGVEGLIEAKDKDVEEAASAVISSLQTEISDKLETWAEQKYADIQSKAEELDFQYPTDWENIDVTAASEKAKVATEIDQGSEAKMNSALSNAISEARSIAYNTCHEAKWVAQKFSTPGGLEFRAADIDPKKFNENFGGLCSPLDSAETGLPGASYTGWTVADSPAQEATIKQESGALEVVADESLAEMYRHASDRLAAVKHEVGNVTEDVEADVAEAEANTKVLVNRSDASAADATQLARDVEAEDARAKQDSSQVSAAAKAATMGMTTKMDEAKGAISKMLQGFSEESKTGLEEAKLGVAQSVETIKVPLDTKLLPTIDRISSDLKTKSTSWNRDLGWLETALGKLEETVAKYAGGHADMSSLEKEGNAAINAATYNLEKNKETRKETQIKLDEETENAASDTTMWVKNELAGISDTVRDSLRLRNKDLYDRMSDLAKALQSVDSNFESNSQQLKTGMRVTRQRVAALSDQVAHADQALALDKSELQDSVGVIKSSIKQLIAAHKKTMVEAKGAIDSSLEASSQHDALVYKDASDYMQEQLKSATGSMEQALTSAEGEIGDVFEERSQEVGAKTTALQHNAEDMTFNARTVGQLLQAAYEEVGDRAETLIAGAGSTVELEESTVKKIFQYAQSMQTQLTTEAENALNSNERTLNREKTVIESDQMKAAEQLAKYLQASGMSEQHSLDMAADLVRAAAATVHADEDRSAKTLAAMADEFAGAEADVEAGATNGTALGDEFAGDSAATQAAYASSIEKDQEILAGARASSADVESEADAAGEALLTHVNAETGRIEQEDVRDFDTVEEAIQVAEDVTREGRLQLKAAGQHLRTQSKGLWTALTSYKTNVTDRIGELQGLNAKENRTLSANTRLLKAYMHHTLALEKQMLEGERARIQEERAQADKDFDATELRVAAFSQEVSTLMNTDAFQSLRKIQQADENVERVEKENDAFVQWLKDNEATSIPWMKNVLQALSEAHTEKQQEEWKKKVMEKALALREDRQTQGSFSKVEGLVGKAGQAMSSDEFARMRRTSTELLSRLGRHSGQQDAAAMRELRGEMAGYQQAADGEIGAADAEVQATRSQVIGANQGVTEVGGTLERALKSSYKQTDNRVQQTEQSLDSLVDKAMLPDAAEPWTDAYFSPSSLLERQANETIASSFVEGDNVTAADAVEWVGLLSTMHKLGENYTALTEANNELGLEVAHLRGESARTT